MYFTYESYARLIDKFKKYKYDFKLYNNIRENPGKYVAVIRHDIDYNLDKAYILAKYEKEMGIKTTYLLLLSGDFYNVFSFSARKIIREIQKMGHDIGLHFDETIYKFIESKENMKSFFAEKIVEEAKLLSNVTEMPISVVSMHRPSKMMLDMNLNIPNIINTYSEEFFVKYKYLSDSRRNWREPVEEIIEQNKFEKIQILIHPFWYNEVESNLHDSVKNFVKNANKERYKLLNNNISNLYHIMSEDEV